MRWVLLLLPLLVLASLQVDLAPPAEDPGPKVVVGPLLTPPNPDVYAALPYVLQPTGQPVSVTPARSVEELAVLLIEFPDEVASASHSAAYFDGLMFDDQAGASSVRNFYRENSYGQTDVVGTVSNQWYMSGELMSFYGEDGSGIDDENGPIYCLAAEAALEADGDVDFSQFDGDGDGTVDHLVIVHAGEGQENAGNSNLIWSHRWAVIDARDCGLGSRQLVLDGVRIYGYFMTSENSPMGVFAHEFGHDFGLIDLYDTTGNTLGIGVWGLMGTGSWNGVPRGTSPAHFIAWHKDLLGWLTLAEVTDPLLPANLPQVETDAAALKLPVKTSPQGEEYFVVENRQRVGFDAGLPGGGLLIWHVDETHPDNDVASRRLVDLEEADEDQGFLFAERPEQPSDAWQDDPVGFTGDANATPNSEDNDGAPTGWKVTGISPSGPLMTANVSRGVAVDLAILNIVKEDIVTPNGTVDLDVQIVNRGLAEVDNATMGLDVYYEAYELDARVLAEGAPIPVLAEGEATTVTFSVTPAAEGRYLVEAALDVPADELPQNNLRIVHFLAMETLVREDMEDVPVTFFSPTNANSTYRWEVVEDGDGYGLAHSPTGAWRFGYVDTPGPTQSRPSYYLQSPSFGLQGEAPHLVFYQRYRLTTRTGGTGPALQPLDSDQATVEVAFDGGVWIPVAQFTGTQDLWDRAYVDLAAYAGATSITLRFRATADVMPEDGGWWIDDVIILPEPLESAALLRPLNTQEEVVPGGSARFDFLAVNVGDLDETFSFQVEDLPGDWDAFIGDNETAGSPVESFNVSLQVDEQLLLTLVVRVSLLAERGAAVQGTLRGMTSNATAESLFVFTVQVPLGWFLNLSGRTLVVALIIGGLMLAIAIVLTAMRNRRSRVNR